MEFWEFLIQKEGDRSWLPLESPSVEILEGRYRVVARSNRASTATEIRVTHYATTETPPVRRVRKRSSQTNPDGLIVILPFTRLQPGLWELRCTGDVMAEMMGENWQYAVQLDVVPQEQPVDEWHPDWQGTAPDAASENLATINEAVAETAQTATETSPTPEVESVPSPQVASSTASTETALLDGPTEEQAAPTPVSEVTSPQPACDQSTDQLADQSAKPAADLSQALQQIEQASEQLVDSIFRNLTDLTSDLTSESALMGEASTGAIKAKATPEGAEPTDEQADFSISATELAPQLQVILEQETFVIQRSESLNLTGRVEYMADPPSVPITISELRVRLYDPQTSAILMDEAYPIDNRVPPFPFSGQISLPEHYQTYLVLGELIFRGSAQGSQQVLAIHSFNVTTDLHELIESIANDFPDVETLPPGAMPVIAEPMPAVELNRLASKTVQRSSQQPLPPQLRPADPTRTHASLQLPAFAPANATPPTTPETTPQSEQTPVEQSPISTSAADLLQGEPALQLSSDLAASDAAASGQSDAEAVSQVASEPTASEPPASERVSQATPESNSERADQVTKAMSESDGSDLFLNWEDLGGRVPIWRQRKPRPADLSNAPEDISFRALNLQHRFLQRLQALATNPEIAAALGAFEANEASALFSLAPTETMPPPAYSLGLDAELAADEIVVEDERVGPTHPSDVPSEPEIPLGPVLPEDEPIPTPRLQLPTGEMIAGRPFVVTIKLPSLDARVYVKLWLRDRQTRELIGTPRWIIDFLPDGFGNQMARTEVIVPPGCIKVQFEAIAVEIATQRESDKVTLTRPILPPDLSPLSLDGLEI